MCRSLELQTNESSLTRSMVLSEAPKRPSHRTPSQCDFHVLPSRSQRAPALPPSESNTQDFISFDAGSMPIQTTTCVGSSFGFLTSYSIARYRLLSSQRHLRSTFIGPLSQFQSPTSQASSLSGSSVFLVGIDS